MDEGDFRYWFLGPILRGLSGIQDTLAVLTEKINKMAEREDAAFARQEELIGLVRDGSAAKDAEIAALREALVAAGEDAVRRVEEALAADSEFDAERVERGNAALAELVATPVPVDPNAPVE